VFDTIRFKEGEEAMLFGQDLLSKLEMKILSLIDNDSLISVDAMALSLKEDVQVVKEVVTNLQTDGYLKGKELKSKVGDPIKYTLTRKGSDIITIAPKSVSIKSVFEYKERPNLPALITESRPFCKKLIALGRVYSASDIQTISQKVGYDVFEYTGGFYHNPDTNETTPYCRHHWVSRLIYTT
jgi:hypothetical protein